MDYQMLYVRSRKNWKGRKENFLFILPSAKKNTLGKQSSLPSVLFWHSANKHFAECIFLALRK